MKLAVRYISSFLLLMLLVTSCESQKTIVNGLNEREANEIIVFLAGKGIETYKIQAKSEGPGGGGGGPIMFDIAVDSERAVDAMALLNANGLPRRHTERLLELFTQGGLVPSEMQDKIRFQQGLAEQVGGMVRKIDGVLDCEVQLSFPPEDPLNPGQSKGDVTAAVFVKHNGILDDPNSHLITKIRRMVASSVQGLKFENVTVIPDRARFVETSGQKSRSGRGNVDLARVWSIVVAQESISRFQIMFLSLTVLCCFFIFTTAWLAWKVLPVAMRHGGISTLFSLHAIEETEVEIKEEVVDTEIEESDKETQKKGSNVQENIESP